MADSARSHSTWVRTRPCRNVAAVRSAASTCGVMMSLLARPAFCWWLSCSRGAGLDHPPAASGNASASWFAPCHSWTWTLAATANHSSRASTSTSSRSRASEVGSSRPSCRAAAAMAVRTAEPLRSRPLTGDRTRTPRPPRRYRRRCEGCRPSRLAILASRRVASIACCTRRAAAPATSRASAEVPRLPSPSGQWNTTHAWPPSNAADASSTARAACRIRPVSTARSIVIRPPEESHVAVLDPAPGAHYGGHRRRNCG